MLSGQAAIDYLAVEAIKHDHSASSHWQIYHSDFKFTGQEFTGLQGFGARAKQYTGLRLWFMQLQQRRFRQFGDPYAKFNSIYAIASEVTCKQVRAYDLVVLRQTLTLAFLHESAPSLLTENTTCCVILNGFHPCPL